MLFYAGNDIWLPAQIAFLPLKMSDGNVGWILTTRFGQRLVRDDKVMAVNLRVWLQCWFAQNDVVSTLRTRHS